MFPPTRITWSATLSAEDWFACYDKAAAKVSLKPEGMDTRKCGPPSSLSILLLIPLLLFPQFHPYNKCPWWSRNQQIIRILLANPTMKAINSKRYVSALSLYLSLSFYLSRSNACSHSCRYRNRLARAWNIPANWNRTTWRVWMRTSGRSSVSKVHTTLPHTYIS